MINENRLEIARAIAKRDWRDNKEARTIRNPRLADEYNRVYGELYAKQEQMTGVMYAPR